MVSDVYKFLVPILLLGLLLAWLQLPYVALIPLILAAYVCYFFRNPKREIPQGKNLIVSPADGKVVKIAPTANGTKTISIFLNIFNVHVTRAPIAGRLDRMEYMRGKFKAAFDEEASRVNEQNILTISGQGIQVVVRQIAGLIARRVVCWKKIGQTMARGELFGLIRFGSRVDITIPEHVKILVNVGDRVRGGSSILGDYS
ncbi:MAG: phosphatidylserine decarboxylase family protein [Acidobacteriota bacterium]|nr:phosphatidylserine decarboxylase family protein [Acidobacteriota bacterium]